MHYIDLHCDTAMRLYGDSASSLKSNSFSIDLIKLKEGENLAQVFAIFVDAAETGSCFQTGIAMLERLVFEIKKNQDCIAFAVSSEDVTKNQIQGRLSAFLSLEEGGIIEGSLEKLKQFYDMGVRFITLTWNYPNEIGFPHQVPYENNGLTSFGYTVVEEMQHLGMLVDVSHLSEGGFWDVVRLSRRPFVATHSNCRALRDHTRNLTDKQIKALSDSGGVMGICVAKNFLLDGPDEGRVEAMAAHIDHACQKGGIEVVAIGTDFDGTVSNHELEFPADLQKVIHLLEQKGYSQEYLEKILWRNALRVFNDVLG